MNVLASWHAGALARGDAAINLRFPHKSYREKIWDHVAGALIVEEAGGKISDASGAQRYCYNVHLTCDVLHVRLSVMPINLPHRTGCSLYCSW